MMRLCRASMGLCALALALTTGSLPVDAEAVGKACDDTSDCSSGSVCVAGDSESPIQQCVPQPACGANKMGSCPADPTVGRLACIWRPDEKDVCDDSTACESRNGTRGIYKCLSIERCDLYSESKDACSSGCLASNGKPCNGVGNCQLADVEGDLNKFTCSCFTGWSGDTCEKAVDASCVSDVGQCGENGDCVDSECECRNGYKGDQCEIAPKSSKDASGSNDTSGSKNATPAPTKEGESTDSQSTDNKQKNESSGTSSTAFIVIGILAGLLVVAALLFALYSRKKKREQHVTGEPAAGMEHTDSMLQGGGPATPRQNIVIM